MDVIYSRPKRGSFALGFTLSLQACRSDQAYLPNVSLVALLVAAILWHKHINCTPLSFDCDPHGYEAHVFSVSLHAYACNIRPRHTETAS